MSDMPVLGSASYWRFRRDFPAISRQCVQVLRRHVIAVFAATTLIAGVPIASASAVDGPSDQSAPVVASTDATATQESTDVLVVDEAAAANTVAENVQGTVAELFAALTAVARLPEERTRELAYAVGIDVADDRRGVMDSLYRGEWFMPKREDVRKCIVDRESNGHYRAVSAGGDFRGAYQMSEALGIGATWMMQPEVKKEMGPRGVDIVQKLRKTPVQKWNRYWQDRAFWTIWGRGDGRSHWGGCK